MNEVTALTILDDVEQTMSAALKRLERHEPDLLEYIDGEHGVYLEAWRDDIRTAMKLIGGNL